MSRLRVVLAEDDILLREGLASLLERSGFAVVGRAGGGAQLLALVRQEVPELVVVDIRMPPTNTTEGLEAARVIRQEFPATGIVVLSAHAEIEHAMELLASGRGIGYLLNSRVTDVAESACPTTTYSRWPSSPGPCRWRQCSRHTTCSVVRSRTTCCPTVASTTSGCWYTAHDWRSNSTVFTGDSYRHNLAALRALDKFAADRGMTVSQLAITWTLANPAVHVAIVGARQADHVQDSLAAADLSLSTADLAAIDKIMASATPVTGPSPESV